MNLELRILEGPQAGRRLPVTSLPVTIGRSPTAQHSFPQDSFMSSNHLSVRQVDGGVLLIDLSSTNGTFLNGERITQAIAGMGAVIKIGSLMVKVVQAHAPVSGKVLSSPLIPQAARPQAASPSGATTMMMTLAMPAVPEAAPEAPAPAPVAPQRRNSLVLTTLRQTSAPLFCLLDAAADASIPSLLTGAWVDLQKHSLLDAGVDASALGSKPYLLPLPWDSPLLPALVETGWGQGWAAYFTSSAPFEDLSSHFKKFLTVQLQAGNGIYFRFYDPRVLREFLPAANSGELAMFFGPVAEWLIEAESKATLLRIRNESDGLKTLPVPVLETSSTL